MGIEAVVVVVLAVEAVVGRGIAEASQPLQEQGSGWVPSESLAAWARHTNSNAR